MIPRLRLEYVRIPGSRLPRAPRLRLELDKPKPPQGPAAALALLPAPLRPFAVFALALLFGAPRR